MAWRLLVHGLQCQVSRYAAICVDVTAHAQEQQKLLPASVESLFAVAESLKQAVLAMTVQLGAGNGVPSTVAYSVEVEGNPQHPVFYSNSSDYLSTSVLQVSPSCLQALSSRSALML